MREAALRQAIRARVPPAHVLRSAVRAGRALDASGTPLMTAHASYVLLPTGGLYHCEDLMRGEQLLVESGLVGCVDDVLYPSFRLQLMLSLCEEDACEILLATALSERAPLWLSAASRGNTLSSELIPDADFDALAETIADPARREALLLALGNRYDPEGDIKLGNIGEELVLAECRAELSAAGRGDLAERVQRVSLISDQLGYDIVAPTLGEGSRRMEVKTTRSSNEVIQVMISRNEAEVGVRDPWWALVVCRISREDTPSIVGWCRGDALKPVLPTDQDPQARWASAVLRLRTSQLTPGLPPS